ncbi:hypothetical protein SAMN04488128_105528 [Chitinophaga eiseniae]|uniref:Uncharacterized protein n=1 Tax=Chitinophaga eiseniae TaxID=634771 RepID=A0A1T4TN23_9BACT|nr:hypothetical protein [Chitinophaga eiseniae]SKA41840.1 hypothetical protein SAMN04488128_105528 [Chitinophaga eiseniae]
MIIDDIEIKISKKLPGRYKHFLNEIDDYCFVSYNEYKDEFPESRGVDWFFWGEQRLAEQVVVNGASANRSAWEIIISYMEIKCGVVDDATTFVAIAEDEGDIYSIWMPGKTFPYGCICMIPEKGRSWKVALRSGWKMHLARAKSPCFRFSKMPSS